MSLPKGLRAKTHDFFRNVYCSNYDVIVLTATQLNRDQFNSNKKYGCGVIAAVSNKLKSRRLETWESSCEDLWVLVDINKNYKVALCVVYIPPPVKGAVLDTFINNANHVSEISKSSKLIIGDLT